MGQFEQEWRNLPVKINALSLFVLIALGAVSNPLSAEDRAAVLERIAPLGKVTVEGQEPPAPAPAATETAAAGATAEAPPATETTKEAPAAETATTEATAAATDAAPAAGEAPAAAPAAGGDQLALATASGCMACHQIEMKVVGPAYKDVAAKYKGDDGALENLVAKVKAGGSGTWGPVPMPPNSPQVSDENIRAIVTWVLSL